MTENCTNSQECCPSQLFRPPASGILAQMQELLWTIPCLPHVDPTNCPCANPADQVTTLTGDSGELYDVTLLFRGVVELFIETVDGTIFPVTDGLMTLGGTPKHDGHNIYSLIISNPAATYYLNRWDQVLHPNPSYYAPVYAVRYTATIQIAGGATVTLRADASDGAQVPNQFNIQVPLVSGDPAIGVTQPYDGQFLQMDAISIA